MARPLRIEYEGAFYHITCRGNERKKIYYAKTDYDKFKSYLKDAQDKYGYLLHTYVLMSNHFHLLIETPKANLGKLMHFINGSFTNYINRRRKRSGHLYQGRYKAIVVDSDSYLLELSRYIHLNPVRAKVEGKPQNYPYSSYRSFVTRKKEDIVYRDLILEMISKGRSNGGRRYRAFVERGMAQELEDPLRDVYGGCILGGKGFIKEALGRLQEGIMGKEEVSYRRELQTSYDTDEILGVVSRHLKIPLEEGTKMRGEARKVAIYLLKKYTGMTNKQIGELFGGLSYSAVAKAQERFMEELRKDRSHRKRLERISGKLSNVKG